MPEGDKITIGNVVFNKNDVKSFKQIKNNNYQVELKDSTIFRFNSENQEPKLNPNVHFDKKQVIFENIKGGGDFPHNVIGNNGKVDNYVFKGCEELFINVNDWFEFGDSRVSDKITFKDNVDANGKKIKRK